MVRRNETEAGGPRVADSKRRLQVRALTSQCWTVPGSEFSVMLAVVLALDIPLRCPVPSGSYTRRRAPRTRPVSGPGRLLRVRSWCKCDWWIFLCQEEGNRTRGLERRLSWSASRKNPTGIARSVEPRLMLADGLPCGAYLLRRCAYWSRLISDCGQ